MRPTVASKETDREREKKRDRDREERKEKENREREGERRTAAEVRRSKGECYYREWWRLSRSLAMLASELMESLRLRK